MPIHFHFSSAAVDFAQRGLRAALPCVALIISLGAAHAAPPARADLKGVPASADVKLVTDWIMRNNKHRGHPFVVADKVEGSVFAFDANGALLAKTAALFGAMKSDVLTEEQANKTLAETLASDMITPAGIFPAHAYRSAAYGESVRFAKYANSNLLIHRAPGDKRRRLLQSAAVGDAHMTLGCINVLPEFIAKVLMPNFRGESTVFILPETQPAQSFFAIGDTVGRMAQTQGAAVD